MQAYISTKRRTGGVLSLPRAVAVAMTLCCSLMPDAASGQNAPPAGNGGTVGRPGVAMPSGGAVEDFNNSFGSDFRNAAESVRSYALQGRQTLASNGPVDESDLDYAFRGFWRSFALCHMRHEFGPDAPPVEVVIRFTVGADGTISDVVVDPDLHDRSYSAGIVGQVSRLYAFLRVLSPEAEAAQDRAASVPRCLARNVMREFVCDARPTGPVVVVQSLLMVLRS